MDSKFLIIILFLLITALTFVSGTSLIQAGNIQTNLQPSLAGGTGGSTVVGGDAWEVGINSGKANLQDLPHDKTSCNKLGGCWDEYNGCYPLGYIKEGFYCYDKAKQVGGLHFYEPGFVNQSPDGEPCNNNYECKSDICLDSFCTNVEEIINNQVDLRLKEMEQKINNKSKENPPQNNSQEETSTTITGATIETQDERVLKELWNWLKGIFS